MARNRNLDAELGRGANDADEGIRGVVLAPPCR